MARILICHVPKDGSIAREVGAALMGRGHYVSFDGDPDTARADRSARVRQFEAVIVIWTETSVPSAGLSAIATETMPLNLLVPLRSDELPATRLPLAFRKLSMVSPKDTEGIARVVARLGAAAVSVREMTEQEAKRAAAGPVAPQPKPPAPPKRAPSPKQAAPTTKAPVRQTAPQPPPIATKPHPNHAPAPPVAHNVHARPLWDLPEVDAGPIPPTPRAQPRRVLDQDFDGLSSALPEPTPAASVSQHQPPALTADDLARAVDDGLLAHHIPPGMWLGAPTTVEITLNREVLNRLIQAPAVRGAQGPVIETISVSLYGNAEAFEIERQSERTQFVNAKHALATRDPATHGRWIWMVTPFSAGPQDLIVRISALLRDRNGVPAPVAIPDRPLSVDVQIPEDETLMPNAQGWYRS